MTIAEQLRREGEHKGIQKGKLEGIQEGEKQASLKIVRQLLEKGVERDIVKLSTGLTDAELRNLFND